MAGKQTALSELVDRLIEEKEDFKKLGKEEKIELVKRADYLTKDNLKLIEDMEKLKLRIYELKSQFVKNRKIKFWFNSEDMGKVLKTYKRKNKSFIFLIKMQEKYESLSFKFQENINEKFEIFEILQGKKDNKLKEFIRKVKEINKVYDNYIVDFPF